MATYNEAKAAGERVYEGKPCRRGHTRRLVKTNRCEECRRGGKAREQLTRSRTIDATAGTPRPGRIHEAVKPAPKPPGPTARYSLAAMWRRDCPRCGPESLFQGSKCTGCGRETHAKQERRPYRHPPPQLTMPIAEGANILALMSAKA